MSGCLSNANLRGALDIFLKNWCLDVFLSLILIILRDLKGLLAIRALLIRVATVPSCLLLIVYLFSLFCSFPLCLSHSLFMGHSGAFFHGHAFRLHDLRGFLLSLLKFLLICTLDCSQRDCGLWCWCLRFLCYTLRFLCWLWLRFSCLNWSRSSFLLFGFLGRRCLLSSRFSFLCGWSGIRLSGLSYHLDLFLAQFSVSLTNHLCCLFGLFSHFFSNSHSFIALWLSWPLFLSGFRLFLSSHCGLPLCQRVSFEASDLFLSESLFFGVFLRFNLSVLSGFLGLFLLPFSLLAGLSFSSLLCVNLSLLGLLLSGVLCCFLAIFFTHIFGNLRYGHSI